MSNHLIENAKVIFQECLELLEKKNKDYSNEENPYYNFKNCENIGVSVEKGILVRIMDKISRVNILLEKNNPDVVNESIQDTLKDLCNYSVILLSYLEYKKITMDSFTDAMIKKVKKIRESTIENLYPEEKEIDVVFKKIKGEIIAIFPTLFTSETKKYITSYSHIGQHSDCHINLLKSKNALQKDYQLLLDELISIGYKNLNILNKKGFMHKI